MSLMYLQSQAAQANSSEYDGGQWDGCYAGCCCWLLAL